MNSGPIWITTSGFLFTATELLSTSTTVVASGTNVTYRLISGQLPSGMTVSTTGTIFGIPAAVLDTTDYDFVIRATDTSGIADRYFNLRITGSQPPVWSTSSGYSSTVDYNTSTAYLKLGPTGENFTLNKQYVNYQFTATATTAPSDTKIRYYISENGGILPPGLLLSQDGVLSGFMNDDLVFDGTEPDTGGYDEEAYDKYTYDFGLSTLDSVGVPKIYQFKVTASDGIRTSDRFFKILVVSPEMIRNPSLIQMNLETNLITTNSNYVPPPQFVNGTDLGVARAENNETFDVSAYNGYPFLGYILYTTVDGGDRYSRIPDFLKLEPNQGKIYGYIPYQPAYTENYQITVNAIRYYNTATVTATNTFTLAIKGEVESSIEWVSSSTLGTIIAGRISEFAVVAQQINSDYSIKYFQTSGTIPPGLTLERDGSLSGRVEYGNTGTYTFGVKAQDVLELSGIERNFTLKVEESDNKQYTRIWVKPFLSVDKRSTFRDFMTDTFTFPQASIYRFFDPNFGIQTDIKLILEFGIEKQNLAEYIPALRENFYKRRFQFGDIKIAVAKDSTGSTIYEVVYIDIIDNMMKNNTDSVSNVVYSNNKIYYPNSVTNMKNQLEHLTLNANDIINVDEFHLPVFMRTAQSGDYKPPGYMQVMPLCYALPGEGSKIVSRIKLSQFDFKQFDFEIDRLIMEKTTDNSDAKYLLFPRKDISATLESDSILYVFDETALETNNNVPINRE